jgi:hypothetical protein
MGVRVTAQIKRRAAAVKRRAAPERGSSSSLLNLTAM